MSSRSLPIVMLPQPEPGLAKAAHHYRRAGQYQSLAQSLLAGATVGVGVADAEILTAAAGALRYEAAKQCVNAVANLNGRDPQANHEKMAALRAIADAHPNYPNLIDDSRAAWHLHIHADQFNLPPGRLASAQERTARFVAYMMSIYRDTAPLP